MWFGLAENTVVEGSLGLTWCETRPYQEKWAGTRELGTTRNGILIGVYLSFGQISFVV